MAEAFHIYYVMGLIPAERIWMKKDLEKVAKTTPVIVFCHDQPTCEAKHIYQPYDAL